MELKISKSEIEELIDEEYVEGNITEKQKKDGLNDLFLRDYTEWIEQGSIYIEFEFAKFTVHKFIHIESLTAFVEE